MKKVKLMVVVAVLAVSILGLNGTAHATANNYFQTFWGLDGQLHCTVGWGNLATNARPNPWENPDTHFVQAVGKTYSRRGTGCAVPENVPVNSTAVKVTLYKGAAPMFGGVECASSDWKMSYGGTEVGTYLLNQKDMARYSLTALYPVGFDVRQCGSYGSTPYGWCQYIAHIEHLGPWWAYGEEWSDLLWAQCTF
jgi:hypothetical protein